MAALAQPDLIPVGVFKTFGETGPMYEILGSAPSGSKGEMVSIRVFFTGEELAYPLADMLADPVKP